jgi:hypothetical protein
MCHIIVNKVVCATYSLNGARHVILHFPAKRTSTTKNTPQLEAQAKMVYTLVCHLHAKEGKDVEEKIHNKLVEASQTYMKDAEVIGWHVMQDHVDTRKWTIVERYERPSVRNHCLLNLLRLLCEVSDFVLVLLSSRA